MPKHEDRERDDYRSRKHKKHDRREEKYESKRIKREEDFDRRQEELSRRRRRESRPQSDDRDRRNHQRSHRDEGNDRRRYDDNERRDRQRGERDIKIENAFKNSGEEEKKLEKEKPNLGLSGALTEDTNTYKGVVIKYNEPPEARIPKKRWRLYPFKGSEALKTLHLHRQSAFLLGRMRRIVDIPIDHPSCSKQHAVLQFRRMDVEVDGALRRRVKPYVIDLGSANGTYVNNERIEAQRYVELKEQDVLKFGFSSREYVLLHDKSDTTDVQSESDED